MNSESLSENPYFKIWSEGHFRTEDIKVEAVSSSRILPSGLKPLLAKRWEEFQGEKRLKDEEPSRFMYEGHGVDINGVFTLKVSPSISYKNWIIWGPEFTRQFGLESAPLAVGATTIIETSDGKVILTKRSLSHDYKPGGLSGVGGFLEIKRDSRSDGTPDILRALSREVEEETGIKFPEIKNTTLYGIIHNPISGSVGLVFLSATDLTSTEIKKRKHDDENELLFIDIKPDVIQNLILTKTNAFTTEIIELLISMGGHRFGKRWEEETREIFKLRGISYAEAINRGPYVVEKLEKRDIGKLT